MIDILQTALVAFGIVMTGMVLLTGLCLVLRQVSRTRPPASARAPAPMADPLLLAVLTAAAAEVLQRPVRVHRVHVHGTAERERWSRAGRMDVMVSHRVGPRR